MSKKQIYLIFLICISNILKCSQFQMLMRSTNTVEDRNRKIKNLAFKIYGKKYERGVIDFVISQILNGPKIY